MSVDQLKEFIAHNGFDYIFDVPMKNYTTLKIGGKADIIVQPRSADELEQLILKAKQYTSPIYFMGNGSNILVKDNGVRGMIIKFGANMASTEIDGNIISAGAGISMAHLASIAAENSLAGFEFASGIPGTLGGGIVMNAGAYKGEMGDVVIEATALCGDSSVAVLKKEDLDFSYRHSCFTGSNMLVLSAKLLLQKGNKEEIKSRIRELAQKRRTTQPLEYPSAGSAFKRPASGYAAAMIDSCGLKGYCVGDAQVSEKHAGFVVNKGNATARDVIELLTYIQKTVKENFNTVLEPEIIIMGED